MVESSYAFAPGELVLAGSFRCHVRPVLDRSSIDTGWFVVDSGIAGVVVSYLTVPAQAWVVFPGAIGWSSIYDLHILVPA